jgi:acetyl esterase/lipase
MRNSAIIFLGLLVQMCGPLSAQDDRQRQPPDPFQRLFTLPGIEFSQEQQVQVAALREEFQPRLVEIQEKWNGILTPEQVRARNEAYRTAREAGKEGQELREAVEAAVGLTDEQKQQQADLQEERGRLLDEIRTRLIALLTDEQRARIRQPQRAQELIPPTHADVKYGPHDRNVMDVWLATSDKPTPVLVSIHGGGFLGGDKSVDAGLLRQCLDSGISVAAITYRYSSQAIAPAPFRDSARAVQFVRSKSTEWNIDPERFAATGGSAGAGISLWLGFHDDLADPDHEDPVLRQSTRLTCMVVHGGQTSYDPRFIRELFPGSDTYKHGALVQLFDADLDQLDELPDDKYRLFEECSPLHHLTKDDVPAMLMYGGSIDQEVTDVGIGIHHALFGQALKERMDELGIRCIVNAGGQMLGDGERVSPLDFIQQEFEKVP